MEKYQNFDKNQIFDEMNAFGNLPNHPMGYDFISVTNAPSLQQLRRTSTDKISLAVEAHHCSVGITEPTINSATHHLSPTHYPFVVAAPLKKLISGLMIL